MSLFSSDSDRVCIDRDEDLQQSVDLVTGDMNRKLDLESDYDSTPKLLPDSEVHEGFEDEDEEDDDDDFTFMYIGDKDSPMYADKVFEDGQIRPVFPLFDQNLLLGGEYEVEEIDRLPVHPTVDKIFIESPRGHPSSTASEHEENNDVAAGPFCVWSKESVTGTAELSKKSNSTGFSKLWRIREKVGRSNSDGRDAFVFLKSSDRTSTTTTTSSSSTKPATGAGSFVKVNAAGEKARVVKQGTKAKKPTVSPHEAYLRSKGEHTEEERRRSYLPYRPELMGFFTNVHGGLSKNVHPY
ncbi:uncharacterized protein LOC112524274 [Cynara cardunculus var. scolymus]|uniref:Uncharacterized protein n=1 Tax=Cynara cardunculus var. scolymus TaxID=59895 RepID=A0A124SG88_CYNCS|nr:uncharacterized protein LOC112524274 [Cynara cardunculus var. scolymus]KVI05642.1 Protein of unknown function DUF1645 [Cynara cardunculus var. scolymus]